MERFFEVCALGMYRNSISSFPKSASEGVEIFDVLTATLLISDLPDTLCRGTEVVIIEGKTSRMRLKAGGLVEGRRHW